MKPVLNRVVALLLALLMCLSVAACAGGKEGSDNKQKQNIETITVTDMLGRKVDGPKDTKSTTVASTYGVVVPFLVTLEAGDRAKAVNFKNKKFYRLVNDPIINAGTIGTRVSVDSEALAKVDPDVYICRTTDKADIDLCARLGIPSIAITAELPEEVFQAYELLGELLGCEERAKEVTDYLKNELKDIDALAETIPEEDKVTALCMGSLLSRVASEDMLQTMLLKRVGAITVVDGIKSEQERYWADCGVEKIFELNPDFIFVTSSAALNFSMDDFYKDSAWAAMTAVKNKHIYKMPAKLDSWDMPGPGFILAMYYMMHQMYPDVCTTEMLQNEVDDYYEFFFGRTFTGDEIGYEF